MQYYQNSDRHKLECESYLLYLCENYHCRFRFWRTKIQDSNSKTSIDRAQNLEAEHEVLKNVQFANVFRI